MGGQREDLEEALEHPSIPSYRIVPYRILQEYLSRYESLPSTVYPLLARTLARSIRLSRQEILGVCKQSQSAPGLVRSLVFQARSGKSWRRNRAVRFDAERLDDGRWSMVDAICGLSE